MKNNDEMFDFRVTLLTGVSLFVVLVTLIFVLGGCAATRIQQDLISPTLDGGVVEEILAEATQQSGLANVSSRINATGWTGIEYSTAVPIGQVVLMLSMIWLSHRREMHRIRQNDKHKSEKPQTEYLI